MAAIEWTAVMVAVLIAALIVLVKFLICNCIILRRDDDSRPILPSRREAFWLEYDRLRMQAMRTRQPPPDFEEALRNSRPVSYLDVEEEPPPTYEDFLKSLPNTPAPSLATSPSTSVSTSAMFEDNFVDIEIAPQEQDTGFTLTLSDLAVEPHSQV